MYIYIRWHHIRNLWKLSENQAIDYDAYKKIEISCIPAIMTISNYCKCKIVPANSLVKEEMISRLESENCRGSSAERISCNEILDEHWETLVWHVIINRERGAYIQLISQVAAGWLSSQTTAMQSWLTEAMKQESDWTMQCSVKLFIASLL
jgi:hypothetical protein